MSKAERLAYMLVMSPQFLLPLYAIFVPFTTNSTLLSAGLLLFAAGQTLRLKSIWDYTSAAQGELINHGVYRISRNPGYFGAALVYMGMGVAGGSWLTVQ
ncbi:MAG: phosphatidylethanolamine N-methyltransferase family protein [Anaerolineales bacterium]|nr:phosphatidylethanolamine N-methyltransferase family protein [Anaerolineales bacterium]